jgi:hypothetical protein
MFILCFAYISMFVAYSILVAPDDKNVLFISLFFSLFNDAVSKSDYWLQPRTINGSSWPELKTISVRIVGITAEIRTGCFLNTSRKHYRFSQRSVVTSNIRW